MKEPLAKGRSVLSAESFAATRLPLLQASTLPPYCYSSREFYELEVERIFMREWLCVGRVNQVEKPGDYFTLEVAGEPVLVVRDHDGAIRALSNVCRHRGALVAEGEGNQPSFECPFHGWTYSLRGELIGAPLMEKAVGFDKSECGLPPLRLEEWEGFVFINFDPQAKPLSPRLTGLSQKFRNYGLAGLRAAKPMIFTNACNWKYGVENGADMYHVFTIHEPEKPESLYYLQRTTAEEDPEGAYTTSFTPAVRPYPYLVTTGRDASSRFPALEGLSEYELGLLPENSAKLSDRI